MVHSPQSETNSLWMPTVRYWWRFQSPPLRAGVFVPVGSAEEVGEAVAVHVEGGDAFGVVGAETMDEEGGVGCAVGAGAGGGFAELGGVSGVLGVGEMPVSASEMRARAM